MLYSASFMVCVLCVCLCAGVCLGLQMAVIEFSRTVLGWTDAQSTEFDKDTTHPVVMGTHNTLEDKFKLYGGPLSKDTPEMMALV